jgi:hypothetical protein
MYDINVLSYMYVQYLHLCCILCYATYHSLESGLRRFETIIHGALHTRTVRRRCRLSSARSQHQVWMIFIIITYVAVENMITTGSQKNQ